MRLSEEGVKQMFCMFLVDVPLSEAFPWGKEVIYRNGKYAGYITSANYGFTIGKHICMGYVCRDDGKKISLAYLKQGKYEIEVDGKRYPANQTMRAVYDPNSVIPKSS